MESDSVWYQDILIGIVGLVIAIVPAIPYGVVAAVFGAKFGILTGTIINVSISVIAAMILFTLVRRTFTVEARAKASKMKGIRYLSDFAERNAFFAIFFARTLPIVPAQAVNIFAAVTRISWVTFLFATILGKVPFIAMVTIVGDRFFQDADITEVLSIVGGYTVYMALVYGVYRFMRKTH